MGEFFDDKVENFIRYMLGGYATNKIGEAKKNWEQWKEENTIQEIVVIAEDFLPSTDDSECTCRACVMCTKATKGSEPVHIKKKDALIHIGDIGSLDETDIEMDGVFAGCTVGGTCLVSKEYIQGGVWQEPNEKSDYGENRRTLSWINSYMICERYENGVGVIYFHDDGQNIKELWNEQKNSFSEWAKENRINGINFLEPFFEVALEEQLRTGVPWQVTLSQIACESSWGKREVYDEYTHEQSFNLFGIKYFGKIEDEEKYVRSWTKEDINRNDLDEWKKEQKKWALNDEELEIVKTLENGKIEIKVIQPFRRYQSYLESIHNHSEVLLDDRYLEAWEHEDNPYIYMAIISPIYASGTEYENTTVSIMRDYFSWDDKEEDWEEYNIWRNSK